MSAGPCWDQSLQSFSARCARVHTQVLSWKPCPLLECCSLFLSCLQVLKKLINKQRPKFARKADPGMPSSHASSLAYLSVYMAFAWQPEPRLLASLGLGLATILVRCFMHVLHTIACRCQQCTRCMTFASEWIAKAQTGLSCCCSLQSASGYCILFYSGHADPTQGHPRVSLCAPGACGGLPWCCISSKLVLSGL